MGRSNDMKTSIRRWIALAMVGAAAAWATPAAADDSTGTIILPPVEITGRWQKPIAAVDVSRMQPKLTLTTLRQPFLDRVEKAIYTDPF
jgi:hypothetical protein